MRNPTNGHPFLGTEIWSFQVCIFKGSVQRKLRWVENGVNRSIGASDCGAGHSFVVLFRFYFGFAIFPFPVSTVQIISEFWINRWSGASEVAPNWRYIAATATIIGAAWHSALIEAKRGNAHCTYRRSGQICSANKKFSDFFMFAALPLLAEHESLDQQYWRYIRKTKE